MGIGSRDRINCQNYGVQLTCLFRLNSLSWYPGKILSQSPIRHKALRLPDSSNRSDFSGDFAVCDDYAGRVEHRKVREWCAAC
jgi:hypothetical protein